MRTGQIRFIGPAVAVRNHGIGLEGYCPRALENGHAFIVNFSGYTGRYVWHCHILEHEDNEMMRPYDVVAAIKE